MADSDPLSFLPDIPDLNGTDQQSALATYAQTMWYVQRFEQTLKFFMFLVQVVDRQMDGSFSDLDISEFRERADKTALSRALANVRTWTRDRGIPAIPVEADDLLADMVTLRNHLAHRYLLENWRLFGDNDARSKLIRQLRYYARVYAGLDDKLMPWVRAAMRFLGIDDRSIVGDVAEKRHQLDVARLDALNQWLEAWRLDG